jgi:hypothetical protein
MTNLILLSLLSFSQLSAYDVYVQTKDAYTITHGCELNPVCKPLVDNEMWDITYLMANSAVYGSCQLLSFDRSGVLPQIFVDVVNVCEMLIIYQNYQWNHELKPFYCHATLLTLQF